MIRRHIVTSIAVAQAAIWGFGVYFEHNRGGLRFLDRIESATIDIRTLARGKRVPPDLVTIVAIDDDVVKQRGAYPLPRIDLAKIVDTIAKLEPKVIAIDLLLIDNGAPDADEALASRFKRGPGRYCRRCDFPGREPVGFFRDGSGSARPAPNGREIPVASEAVFRSRRHWHRQRDDGSKRYTSFHSDVVSYA